MVNSSVSIVGFQLLIASAIVVSAAIVYSME